MPHPAPLGRKSPPIPTAFLVAFFIRLLPVLLLPQTAFQPDEFYQSLEPAHALVYGYGHLTWEWRDLPAPFVERAGGGDWYERLVVGGRMRGWIWPGVFALVYKGMVAMGLEDLFLTLGPRLVGVFVAALTDYATYLLSIKVLGTGAGPAAIFLSLTSLFNAHLLPRALSTSPETLLVTLALVYFPLPQAEAPKSITVESRIHSSSNEKVTGTVKPEETRYIGQASTGTPLGDVKELDYVSMDRMAPYLEMNHAPADSLALSAGLACLAVCIRPTTIPFWAYLGIEHIVRCIRTRGLRKAVSECSKAVVPAGLVFVASTGIDYAITGRLYFPILTFIHYNLYSGLSANYGLTNSLYHLTQSLPIMLFPIWYWFAKGFLSSLLPSRFLPASIAKLDRPAGLRTLARALSFAIAALSLSPHSEWRFLHPFLPSLLLFSLPPLFKSYVVLQGVGDFRTVFRQYIRINRRPFYLILLAPLIPYLYLNIFHGRAQVEVMNVLRRGDLGQVEGLVALMSCHSTPWMSHLHKDIPAWFLTCEPPIGTDDTLQHHTQQSIFYDSPVTYIDTVFPYPPSPLHEIFSSDILNTTRLPSHIMFFASLLRVRDEHNSVRDALLRRGYSEVWRMWNGFDFAQDEAERRGGVRVWRLRSQRN